MTTIAEMSMALTNAIWASLLIFLINIILISIAKRLSSRIQLPKEYKIIIFLSYNLLIALLILTLSNQYAGLLDNLKFYLVILSIVFLLLSNSLVYLKKTLSKKQHGKWAIFILFFYLASFLSILIFEGYFQPYDEQVNWSPFEGNITLNGVNTAVSIQVCTQAVAFDGFFPNTPFYFFIYNASVKMSGPTNINHSFSLEISTMPYPYYSKNQTVIDKLATVVLPTPTSNVTEIHLPEPWLISYPYSGEKNLTVELQSDGKDLITFQKNYLTIEKGYLKSQVDTNRVMIIFTIWTILTAVSIFIERIINWFMERKIDDADEFDNKGYS